MLRRKRDPSVVATSSMRGRLDHPSALAAADSESLVMRFLPAVATTTTTLTLSVVPWRIRTCSPQPPLPGRCRHPRGCRPTPICCGLPALWKSSGSWVPASSACTYLDGTVEPWRSFLEGGHPCVATSHRRDDYCNYRVFPGWQRSRIWCSPSCPAPAASSNSPSTCSSGPADAPDSTQSWDRSDRTCWPSWRT
jgi:hypothetical protein